MIVYVKYGFETTPLKMYNTNVSSAILLSFLKATCIKDIDDYCKQRNIQLSIELDAIRRSMQHRKSIVEASAASPTATPASSRPTSGNASASAATLEGDTPTQRPPSGSGVARTGSTKANLGQDQSDEAAAVRVKKETLEKQLETVNTAAKLVKELIAGVAWVDLVDQNGARMNLDGAGNTRVNMLLTARQQYTAVAVTTNEQGEVRTTPLVFKLAIAP